MLCVGQASLPVSCCGCFVAGALRRSHTEGRQPSQTNYLTQWHSREDGRGGGGLEKRRSCVQPCGVTRASLVRARAARALSEAAESRRAVAHVLGVQDVVLCVGQESLPVSCCGCFVAGALRRSHTEGRQPPSLRGGPHAVAAPATWTDLLGARAERVPDCSSYLSRIPWSRAAWVVSPRKRVSCLIKRQRCWRVDLLAGGLKAASLNASAASESTS